MLMKYLLFLLIIGLSFNSFGQDKSQYLKDLQKVDNLQSDRYNLTAKVLSETHSKDGKVKHIYLQQTIFNKPIENAIASLHYNKNGELIFHTNKFHSILPTDKFERHSSLNGLLPHIKKEAQLTNDISVDRSIDQDIHILQSGDENFTVKELYTIFEAGELIPIFLVTLLIDQDYYQVKFHGKSYRLLEKSKAERHCNHSHINQENSSHICYDLPYQSLNVRGFTSNGDGRYLALPFPYENPLQHNISIIEEDVNEASPNGWHDGNGAIGELFNITKGNNVHAYNDRTNTSFPLGDEPFSADRNFLDYNTDLNSEPEDLIELNTVQMFYSVNYLHDLLDRFGFDEESGNFQIFNYSGAPGNADEVRAMVQVDGDDKSTLNEATFFTDIDGIKPRLKVTLFSTGRTSQFSILTPSEISGDYRSSSATFGGEIPESGIEGRIVLARAGEDFPPFLGCDPFTNNAEMLGNIALIDRGDCQFRDKVARAENAGAIAAIICNFEDAVINMGGSGDLQNPDIPSIMIQSSICQEIKIRLQNNEPVNVSITKSDFEGPQYIDGSMDNGVIAHEFMHGVTDRLIGGRLNTNCLFHGESMAEGWSDFLALALTFREDDMSSATPRGIASYLTQQTAEGFGIRRYPYDVSSDNTLTYADITGAATVHQTGEIWATILWEIFWKFIDIYGADDTYQDENSGNFKALYLIIEALKFTACEPGFADARNGILVADQMLYDGENACLLWEIFSKRGLGVNAQQGSSLEKNDGIADFSLPHTCILPIYLEKNMPDLFSIHSSNEVQLIINNTANIEFTEIRIIDTLPPGFTITNMQPLLPHSISNDILSIDLASFNAGAVLNITYTLVAGPETEPSKSILFDPAETNNGTWVIQSTSGELDWELTPLDPFEGNASWNAFYSFGSGNQILAWSPELPTIPEHPMLRFYHKYDSPQGISGGTLQILTEENDFPLDLTDDILKSKYPIKLNPRVFSQSNVEGYSGTISEYEMALIDLQGFASDNYHLIWKYGAYNTTAPFQNVGWTIDNIEILDAIYYDLGISVVHSGNNDIIASLAKSSNGGMLLDTELPTSQILHDRIAQHYKIYPNPANSYFEIEFSGLNSTYTILKLIDINGSVIEEKYFPQLSANSKIQWQTAGIIPGVYLIQIVNGQENISQKIIIK